MIGTGSNFTHPEILFQHLMLKQANYWAISMGIYESCRWFEWPGNKAESRRSIADVFIYLLRIADKLDVRLEDVALAKMKKNAKKYLVEKSKGKAVKYTEL